MKKNFLLLFLILLNISCSRNPDTTKSNHYLYEKTPFFQPYSPEEPEINLPKATLKPGNSITVDKPTIIILDIKPNSLIGILGISASEFKIQTISFPSLGYKIPWENNKNAYFVSSYIWKDKKDKNPFTKPLIKAIPQKSPLKITLAVDNNLITAGNQKIVLTKKIDLSVKFATVVAPNHLIKFYSENGKIVASNETFLGIFPVKEREYKFECIPLTNSEKSKYIIGFLKFSN